LSQVLKKNQAPEAQRGLLRSKAPSSAWGIYSVWRRHLEIYKRTWLTNFLPPVTEPILYLVSFGLGLSPMIGKFHVGGKPVGYMEFIAPAMIAMGVCFQAFFEGAYSTFIRLKYQRTWHALLTAPLGFFEIFTGDLIFAATRGAIGGIVTGLVTVALLQVSPMGLLMVLPWIFLGSLLFGALGVLMAGLVKTIDQLNVPVFLFIMPMFTLSGTFFPRENLPHWLAVVAGWLPLAQLVDLIRWPLARPDAWMWDVAGLVVWTVIAVGLAYRQIYRIIFR
jgi:lipooligosaccharide transport system permease protein